MGRTGLLLVDAPLYEPGDEDLDFTAVLTLLPNLGLAYTAAAAEAAGHSVRIVDMGAEGMGPEGLARALRDERPAAVGLTCTSGTLSRTLRLAALAKRETGAPVVVGGPHAILEPEGVLASPDVDVAVAGGSEGCIGPLLDVLVDGRGRLEGVPGIAFRRAGGAVARTRPLPPAPLDGLPFPARHLLPNERYHHVLSRSRPCTSVVASRGCTYRCIFCSPVYRTLRRRSVANVVDELALVSGSLGVRSVEFFDETFNASPSWVEELSRAIVREGLDISWRARCRPDLMGRSTAMAMRRAGCEVVSLGVESANEATLRFFRKGYTLAQAGDAARAVKEAGMELHGYFILGSPTESEAEMERTIEYAARGPFDYAGFTLLVPVPGSELAALARERGWLSGRSCTDIRGYGRPVLEHPELPPERLRRLFRRAMRRFFMARPSRALGLGARLAAQGLVASPATASLVARFLAP